MTRVKAIQPRHTPPNIPKFLGRPPARKKLSANRQPAQYHAATGRLRTFGNSPHALAAANSSEDWRSLNRRHS